MTRMDSELRELSGHVLYEIQVLFGTAEALEYHATVDNFELPWVAQMASLEAFVVHARALEHFVFRDRGARTRRDDGLADDFFEPGRWAELRPPKEITLNELSPRVGKEIAHITYERTKTTEGTKQWRFAQIAASIGRPLRVFIDNVSQEKVVPDFRSQVRAAFPRFLTFPVAVSYPPDD
jgi:hypothetical protein